jgi:predicted transposase YbfD/YdcC
VPRVARRGKTTWSAAHRQRLGQRGYSLRVTQHADGSETDETRYYILSRYLSGKRFSEAVRGHWAIESMHWVLDVNFRETTAAHANEHLATI